MDCIFDANFTLGIPKCKKDMTLLDLEIWNVNAQHVCSLLKFYKAKSNQIGYVNFLAYITRLKAAMPLEVFILSQYASILG